MSKTQTKRTGREATVQMCLSLRPAILERLRRLSEKEGRPMAWYITKGIKEYVFPNYDPNGGADESVSLDT